MKLTPYKACRTACVKLYTIARGTPQGSPEREFLEYLLHCYPCSYRHLHQLIRRLPAIAKHDVAAAVTKWLTSHPSPTHC